MIYKSYLVEANLDLLKNNIILFYGENYGLLNDLKKKLLKKINTQRILLSQEEILKDQNKLIGEIKNVSLFDDTKVLFINDASDKILNLVEEIQHYINDNKVFVFANTLEKKSKLRNFFEKSNKCDVVPCYQDNRLAIEKIIKNELNGFNGITQNVINLFLDNCGLDRIKISNEIEKVKTYFINKNITQVELEKLLNQNENEDFSLLRNAVLEGNSFLTNRLINNTLLDIEKIPLYISIINQRLAKLKDLLILTRTNKLKDAIDIIKPAIFWKDKKDFLIQGKIWKLDKINLILNKSYQLEKRVKKDADINKAILFKKMMLDICIEAKTSL